MSTPDLHLQTMFLLNADRRIIGTREPEPRLRPLLSLIRGRETCVWAVSADVPRDVANELDRLAREETPVSDFQHAPLHAERYLSLLEGSVYSGLAFAFPEEIEPPNDTVLIEDISLLDRHFSGWDASEIPSSAPMIALIEDGHVVSVCFCARKSDVAAEAGLETAIGFRGRGLAPRVAGAWALAVRAKGRAPLYSTSWANDASLAVARKLDLLAYASSWSIS